MEDDEASDSHDEDSDDDDPDSDTRDMEYIDRAYAAVTQLVHLVPSSSAKLIALQVISELIDYKGKASDKDKGNVKASNDEHPDDDDEASDSHDSDDDDSDDNSQVMRGFIEAVNNLSFIPAEIS